MTSVASLQAPDTRGFICIDGVWRRRRAGLIAQAKLECYDGHSITSAARQKRGERTPMEGVIVCGHRRPPGNGPACDRIVYVYRVRGGRVWAMDLTPDEDRKIEIENMDLDEIIEYFGVSFASF